MAYSDEVLADAPLAYWKLDEAATPLADSTANAKTLTPTGGVTLGAAPAFGTGKSVTLDGTTGYLASDLTINHNDLTIEIWYKGTDGYGVLASARAGSTADSITLGLGKPPQGGTDSPGRVVVGFEDGSNNWQGVQTSTVTVHDNVWHHIVGVWDGTSGTSIQPAQFSIYVDGTKAATVDAPATTQNAPVSSGTRTYRFGHSAGGWPNDVYIGGSLDEIALYPTPLSAARVTAHYNAAVPQATRLTPTLAGTSTLSVARMDTTVLLRPSLAATGALTVALTGVDPVLLSPSMTASSALTVAATVPVNAPIVATVNGSGTLAVPRYIAREHQTATGVAVSGAGELEATHRAQPAAQRKHRWKFNDPSTSERWSMPINPDSMTSPHIPRTFKYAQGIERGIDRLRVFETPQMPHVWEFGGRIRTKSHHDDLAYWARKEHEIEVTDHLGRTFEVLIQEFRPEDRHPQKWHPSDASLSHSRRWRMKYTMRVLLLRRVS